ncbi:hypothetical protein F4824DRAFT_493614 [Ustulina deusta]|nr:hypothetical protein F4824DRAFT_493614 [Ustulina deusta]
MAKAHRARGFGVSATSIHQCTKCVEKLTGGSLNILVNNAAVSGASLLYLEVDNAKNMYDVNCWGLLALAQAFAPISIEARGTV